MPAVDVSHISAEPFEKIAFIQSAAEPFEILVFVYRGQIHHGYIDIFFFEHCDQFAVAVAKLYKGCFGFM
ncbi:hypothetical protein SDC9_207886 [bioreactor metagenome]|uniref:Uncharacterized protein n=1 Tax=bioreactor metagenome TaxID=1076179 RepID=A0A645J965_9ZZZZ